eukprot:5557409-Amphidinium_carterae.1
MIQFHRGVLHVMWLGPSCWTLLDDTAKSYEQTTARAQMASSRSCHDIHKLRKRSHIGLQKSETQRRKENAREDVEPKQETTTGNSTSSSLTEKG